MEVFDNELAFGVTAISAITGPGTNVTIETISNSAFLPIAARNGSRLESKRVPHVGINPLVVKSTVICLACVA